MYLEFYKTALRVCKLDEVIKRYKENHNLVMLSSKVTTVNDIMSALNASRGNALILLKVQLTPPTNLLLLKALVYTLVLDKIFSIKFNLFKKN